MTQQAQRGERRTPHPLGRYRPIRPFKHHYARCLVGRPALASTRIGHAFQRNNPVLLRLD